MLGRWWRRGRALDDEPDDADDADEDDGWDDEDDEDESTAPLVREGRLVRLRAHVPENRPAFQRWYADEEIANLLRHDQRPLNARQSRGYFDTFILPLSARGFCYAIHEAATDRLIGTTALTDVTTPAPGKRSALFRVVIGEKDVWGRGYGTEATRLVMAEAFARHDLTDVRLEVFRHNPRAIAVYERIGFRVTGEHVEWVGRPRRELRVVEMALARDDFVAGEPRAGDEAAAVDPSPPVPSPRQARRRRRAERRHRRTERQLQREARRERQQRRGTGAGAPSPAAEEAGTAPATQ